MLYLVKIQMCVFVWWSALFDPLDRKNSIETKVVRVNLLSRDLDSDEITVFLLVSSLMNLELVKHYERF